MTPPRESLVRFGRTTRIVHALTATLVLICILTAARSQVRITLAAVAAGLIADGIITVVTAGATGMEGQSNCRTLEEFFEVWTWGQLGLHAKPYGLLDVAGFFTPLLMFLDRLVDQRFVLPEHREMLLVEDVAERLLERMEAHRQTLLPKWIDRTET